MSSTLYKHFVIATHPEWDYSSASLYTTVNGLKYIKQLLKCYEYGDGIEPSEVGIHDAIEKAINVAITEKLDPRLDFINNRGE